MLNKHIYIYILLTETVINVPLYLQQIKLEGEGIHPVFLNLGIAKWWWSASRPSHFAPVITSITNGTKHRVVPERLWTIWGKIKFWRMLGFKPRTFHSLAQPILPLRYAVSIQHWLQSCWNAKLIIQQEIHRTVPPTLWRLLLYKLEISCHAACVWTPTIADW